MSHLGLVRDGLPLRDGKAIHTHAYLDHAEALEAIGLREHAMAQDNLGLLAMAEAAFGALTRRQVGRTSPGGC